MAEWIRLAEQKPAELQSAQLAPNEKSKRKDGRGHRKEGGVRAASRELGIDRDTARRSLQVASLSSEAKDAARKTGLDDNRSALLKAASEPALRAVLLCDRRVNHIADLGTDCLSVF